MAIDANIALGVQPIKFESPVNQLAQVLQLQGAQQANQLNQQKMDEYTRGVERSNRLRDLLGGLGPEATDEQRIKALRGGAYFDEADKLEGSILARQKSAAEVGEKTATAKAKELESSLKRLDVAGQAFGFVLKNPTLENAHSVLDYLGANGIYTPEQVAQYKAQTAANPASIPQLAQTAFRSVLSAKDQLGKIDTLNLGDKQLTQSVDPVTGEVRQLGTQVIGQSADNKATNETSRANNAATVGATLRGQNLVDARARDQLSFEKTKEANKATNDKALTEGQSKAVLFGSRMQNANNILGELSDKGVNTSNPGSNAGYGIGSLVTALSGSDQQRLDQAKRDFINAVLRRESGAVIGAEEFANGDKQYFPQIGDSKAVIAQKARNREIAIRGMLAEVPENKRDGLVKDIIGNEKAPTSTKAGATVGNW